MRNISKKTIAISFLAIGILIGSIGTYVYAQGQLTTLTISPGVYPGAPSYTIWREGNYYYAKDAYGNIDYFGTNASQIVNNAYLQIQSVGGTIYFKSGYYEFDAPIRVNSNSESSESRSIRFVGDGLSGDVYFTKTQTTDTPDGTVLASKDGYNGSIFELGEDAQAKYFVRNVEIAYMTISGHSLPYTAEGASTITMDSGEAVIKAYNLINAHFHHLTIINCYYGIYISTKGGTNDGVELSHI